MSTTMPKQLLRPGTRYRLPEVVCSTIPKVNVDYPTIYERNAAWVRDLLPFSDTTTMLRMLENRYPLWESLVYPTGMAERVFRSSCVTSLMFEVDDVAFLQRALFHEVATDWAADHPYQRAFTDIWGTLEGRMPEGIYKRYRQEWQDWFSYTLKENIFRDRGEIPDLETYLSIRRISVGLRPYIVCIEYILDFELTIEDPDLTAVKLAAVEHAMLVNDLFSYRWECFKGDYFNVIAPLLHVHGYSLQEAIDFACEKIAEADQTRTQLSTALRHRYANHPSGAQLHAYFDALGAFCAGNLRWSLETSRYNGHGYGWNGLRTGIITLDREHTIISPR
jgi:hypothetical protein